MRRVLLSLFALLGACAADPAARHLGGFGDPVRGAALAAPSMFGDTSALRGRPAEAARAAVQLEFLADAFVTDPVWSIRASGAVLHALRQGRAEMREALGIAPNAPSGPVIEGLREAAAALDAGQDARAEAALSGPDFPAGGAGVLRRLATLPRLPRVAEAASAAAAEIRRNDRVSPNS